MNVYPPPGRTTHSSLHAALLRARLHLGYSDARTLAMRLALDLVHDTISANAELEHPTVHAAIEAASACVAAGFTTSALARASHASLPLLSGVPLQRAVYPALNVSSPSSAACAALQLVIDAGLTRRANERARALEIAVVRCSSR